MRSGECGEVWGFRLRVQHSLCHHLLQQEAKLQRCKNQPKQNFYFQDAASHRQSSINKQIRVLKNHERGQISSSSVLILLKVLWRIIKGHIHVEKPLACLKCGEVSKELWRIMSEHTPVLRNLSHVQDVVKYLMGFEDSWGSTHSCWETFQMFRTWWSI